MRRIGPDQKYVKTSNYILPNIGTFGSGESDDGYSVHWHVPIDDTHHWQYYIHFSRTAPVDRRALDEYLTVLTPDYRLTRNKANRYLQDRDEMLTRTYVGMGPGILAQDACATEGAGPIQDRTQERLGFTDRLIVGMRMALLRAVRSLQEGDWAPPPPDDCNVVVREGPMPSAADWRQIFEVPPAEVAAR
jgi:hypothetical protein